MFRQSSMGITHSRILQEVKRELGDIVYGKFPEEYYKEIIYNRALMTFSQYMPSLSEPIVLGPKNAVKGINPYTNKVGVMKYRLPNFDKTNITYIDIYDYLFPEDHQNMFSISNSRVTNNLAAKLFADMDMVTDRYTCTFEFPDLVVVSPSDNVCREFTVIMKLLKRFNQIDFGFHDLFIDLCIAYIKHALYRKLPNLRASTTFSGVEINSFIEDFASAKDEIKEIIEELKQEWYKDPLQYPVSAIYSH